jgi:hypothetical protein
MLPPATTPAIEQARDVRSPPLALRRRYRFRLRTLFYLVIAAALISASGRAIVQRDPTMFLGIGTFVYGGIIALPCYAFIASLAGLAAKTRMGQRGSEVFAALVGASAWIAFIIVVLGRWPQLCVAYGLIAVGIMALAVWKSWNVVDESPEPEASLQQLLRAKKECAQSLEDSRAGKQFLH